MKPAAGWLLIVSLMALALIAQTPPATTVPAPAAALAAHMTALRDIHTLTANFRCEKRLAALESPLLSSGTISIAKPNSVRFSTLKPYQSDLILHQGKVVARSQHETTWTKTNQAARPGVTAVMGQLGAWSTGQTSDLTDLYSVAYTTGPIPPVPAPAGTTAPATPAPQFDLFTLTPTNKDLLRAVKQIQLAIDPSNHHLVFVQITTAQDDMTRYWFDNVQINVPLPPDTFTPDARP